MPPQKVHVIVVAMVCALQSTAHRRIVVVLQERSTSLGCMCWLHVVLAMLSVRRDGEAQGSYSAYRISLQRKLNETGCTAQARQGKQTAIHRDAYAALRDVHERAHNEQRSTKHSDRRPKRLRPCQVRIRQLASQQGAGHAQRRHMHVCSRATEAAVVTVRSGILHVDSAESGATAVRLFMKSYLPCVSKTAGHRPVE